jgi:hypothetical protein
LPNICLGNDVRTFTPLFSASQNLVMVTARTSLANQKVLSITPHRSRTVPLIYFGSSGNRVGKFAVLIGLEGPQALVFRHFKGASELA